MTITIDKTKQMLHDFFGYTDFLPGQEEVINRILAKKNAFVVMPTGAGKSLCYQLPALLLDGIVLVVSPLIALMKDQVDQLNAWNIPSTFINSSINPQEIIQRITQMRNGRYKIVYVAPERFYSRSFMHHLKDVHISLFAVDEAHCISEWGHDFRPSYRRLRKVAEFLQPRSIAALTATATPKVRTDIRGLLEFKQEDEVITGFHRPNLFLMVDRIDKEKKRLIRLKEILRKIQGSIIVYATTRKVVEKIVHELCASGFNTTTYHAGLSDEDRKCNQEQFLMGKKRIIVCTNAFGMGINKKDVRAVIHFNLPGSVEAYYQEAGRAGRDGKRAFGILLFGAGDRYLQEFFIQGNYPEKELIEQVYEILQSDNQEIILKTFDDIAQSISGRINEMAVSSVLRILEDHEIIEKLSEKQHKAALRCLIDIDSALEIIPIRAQMQRIILVNLSEIYGDSLATGIQCNLDDLAHNCGVSKDSLIRSIKELQKKDILHYTPPFRGRGIRMLQRELDAENLPVKYDVLEQRSAQEYQKIKEIEGYAYKNVCRHKYLLQYFGDTVTDLVCNNCDICNRKNTNLSPYSASKNDSCANIDQPNLSQKVYPESYEPLSAIDDAFLRLIKKYPNRFGQKIFVDILKGSKNQIVKKWHLMNAPFYGMFSGYIRDELEHTLATLIIKGFILRQKGLYPVLTLTESGKRQIKKTSPGDDIPVQVNRPHKDTRQIRHAKIIKAIIRYGLDKKNLVKESLGTSVPVTEIEKINEKLKNECMEYLHKKYVRKHE